MEEINFQSKNPTESSDRLNLTKENFNTSLEMEFSNNDVDEVSQEKFPLPLKKEDEKQIIDLKMDIELDYLENQEKLGDLKLEDIEVDKNFDDYKNLPKEIRQKFRDKNVFPIKEKYIPTSFFRGMSDSNIDTHKNQLKTFNTYVNNLLSEKLTFKSLLRKIGNVIRNKPQRPVGVGANWYGYTLFTTPNNNPGFHIAYGGNISDKPQYLTEFKIKKDNPIIIKEEEAYVLTGFVPLNKKELEISEKILKEYCIDGILYQSDGNAVAWLDPEKTLEVTKIIKQAFVDTPNKKGEFQRTTMFDSNKESPSI